MATIIDPDFLTDSASNKVSATGPNVFINTANRTIRLNNGQDGTDTNASGALLNEDGVSMQALYSFLKQQWKDDPVNKQLIAYPFPLIAITPEQFEFRYGWKMSDDSSRDLIRFGGWREYAENNTTLNREYLGVVSLGNIDGVQTGTIGATDQDLVYYAFFDSATNGPKSGALNFSFPGEVNQAINTYINGGTDYRGDILRLFIREEGKTYDQTDTRDIGIAAGSVLPYNTQRFPLVEGQDLNVSITDANLRLNTNNRYDSADNAGPKIIYRTNTIEQSNLGYTKPLTGGTANFGVVIDAVAGDGGANLGAQELYSWVQFRLRSDLNIEDSAGASKIGKLQDELLEFVGPTLKTKNVTNIDGGGIGVAIQNFLSTDVNNLVFRDNAGAERSFPFTANGSISFSNEIKLDSSSAKFFVYYDYTRAYGGGSSQIDIANVGPAAGNSALDSANITLTGFSGTTGLAANPITTGGIDAGTEGDNYIRLGGFTSVPGNNDTILKVIGTTGTDFLRVNTIDDVDLGAETKVGAFLYTHPLNSPGSLLVDSAGTAVENTGGITATLAPANLSGAGETFSFAYDYDGNSQKDRRTSADAVDPAIVIRAIGLENGNWVELGGQIIDRVDNQSYSVISAVERNYSNPV